MIKPIIETLIIILYATLYKQNKIIEWLGWGVGQYIWDYYKNIVPYIG